MADATLVAGIAEIARDVTSTPPEVPIAAETRFSEDLGADSFDLVGIIFGVQDRYGVAVPEGAMEGLTTVGALADFVARQGFSEAA